MLQSALANVALTTPLGPFRFTADHDVAQIVWVLAMTAEAGTPPRWLLQPGVLATMLTPGKFRHKALQKMSSPEQLDQLLKVALPRRWIGLVGLLLDRRRGCRLVGGATVPTTLKGPGFLLPQGGLREVQAPASGTVAQALDGDRRPRRGRAADRHVVDAPASTSFRCSRPRPAIVTEADTVDQRVRQRRRPARARAAGRLAPRRLRVRPDGHRRRPAPGHGGARAASAPGSGRRSGTPRGPCTR